MQVDDFVARLPRFTNGFSSSEKTFKPAGTDSYVIYETPQPIEHRTLRLAFVKMRHANCSGSNISVDRDHESNEDF
jgi:hypothetical protein